MAAGGVGVLVIAIVLLALSPGTSVHSLATRIVGWSHTEPQGESLDPIEFATGSCEVFAPTSDDRHQTVFLDAGHGGVDPGGVGTTETGHTVYEADATLPVELDAMEILRSKGLRVVVSRTGDSTVLRLGPSDTSDGTLSLRGAHDDVAARDKCANDAKASVLVGIYFNAGSSPRNAGGLTAYDADRSFSQKSLALATLVQSDVLAAMNAQGWAIPDDGVLVDTSLGSLVGDPYAGGLAAEAAAYHHLLVIGPAEQGFFSTPSVMPGAVLEPLYITDPFEGSVASSPRGQLVIARGIATAVEQFLTPAAKTTSPTG